MIPGSFDYHRPASVEEALALLASLGDEALLELFGDFLGNPRFKNLVSDPRYPLFLEKLGLLEYWQAMPPEYAGPPEAPE